MKRKAKGLTTQRKANRDHAFERRLPAIMDEKYRTVAEQAADFIFMIDKKNRILSVNNSAAKMLGKTPKEVEGKSIFDMFPTELAIEFAKGLGEVFKTGKGRLDSDHTIVAGGREVWINTRLDPVTDSVGNVSAVMGVSRNITERKLIEGALHRQTDLMQGVFNSAHEAILVLDAQKSPKILDCNRAASEIFGYQKSEMLGRTTAFLHVNGESLKQFQSLIHPAIKQRLPVQLQEIKMKRKDGSVFPVEQSLSLLFSDKGDRTGWVSVVRDLTTGKRAEEWLRESEEKYRAMVENSPNLIGIIQDGVLMYVNSAVTLNLGWTNEELLSPSFDPIARVVSEDSRSVLKGNLARRLRGECIAPYEISLIKKDGSKVPVLVRAVKILYNQQPAIEFVFDDISDRKRMEDKVLALHKHASELSTASSVQTIINHTLDALEFTLGFDHIHFLLVENNFLQIKGSRGKPVAFSALPLDGRGLTVKAANTKITLRIRDTRKETTFVDPEGYDWTGAPTVLSELIVPVLVDAETAAVLCVDSVRLDAFTEEDRILVETLATHVASCLTRLKGEEALRLSEEQYRALFDRMLDGIYLSTHDGQFVDVNPAFVKMFGYSSRQEMLDITDIKKELYFSPEERGSQLADTDQEEVEVYRMRRKDGSEIWVEDHGGYVHDERGNITYHEGILRDITERRRAEEALVESEARFKKYFDLGLIGMVIETSTGNLIAVNDHLCEMLGYDRSELMKKDWAELTHPDDLAKDNELFDSLIRGDIDQYSIEKRFIRKDGQVVHCIIAVNCTRGKDGRVDQVFGIATDITERKRLDEELQKSTQFLERIVENANIWLDVIDTEDNVLIWNKAAESISGYSREEVAGHRKIWGWLYPDEEYRKQIAASVNAIRQGASPEQDVETSIKRKGGETRVISWNERNLVGNDGKVIGSIAIGRDITEQKRMEEHLRRYSENLEELVKERSGKLVESEERYRRLFENSPISLWEEDFSEVKKRFDDLHSKGINDLREYFIEHPEDLAQCSSMVKVLNVNESTLNLYGAKSVEQVRGELRRIFTHEFHDKFREELVALSEGKIRFESKFDNQTLTGDTKHVSLILSVIPGYEETLARVLVSIIDLTAQKQLEQELRSAKERLEYVFESNPAVIYLAKPLPDLSDYATTYQSKSTVSITGFESEEFDREKGSAFWASRVHPDDLASYRAGTAEFWKEGHRACEYRFLHKNGTYRWIREEANVIRDSTGNAPDIIGYWTDITDLKRMEEEILRSNRLAAIGETTSMVAHDLRNPLQGITTAIHLLKQESLTTKERNELHGLIQSSVEYSESIVRDLTEYSAEIQLNLVEKTPKSTIQEALGRVKVPPAVTIHDISEKYPTLRIDSDRMRRVIINIVQNAIDAMPQGGTLTVSSKESNGNTEIDFSDTGSGFPEKIMQNLWKPLQTTKAKGMGLGLPICKRIVDAHGGSISVTSKAGEGTTVTIRLPTGTVEVKPN